MSETWILICIVVVVVLGVAGLVLAGISRDVSDEMPERWRREIERDQGKQ